MSISKVTAPIAPQNELKAVDRVSGGAPFFSASFSDLVDAAANRAEASQARRPQPQAESEAANRDAVRERNAVRDMPRSSIRNERNERAERNGRGERDSRIEPEERPADGHAAAAEEAQPVGKESDGGQRADDADAAASPEGEPVASAAQAAETLPVEQQKSVAAPGVVAANAAVQQVAVQAGGDGVAGALMPPDQGAALQGDAAGAGTMPSGISLPQNKGPAQADAATLALTQAATAAQTAVPAAAAQKPALPGADAKAAAEPAAADAQPNTATQLTQAAAPVLPQAAQLSGLLPEGEAVKVRMQAVTADASASAPPASSGQLLDGGGIFTQAMASGGDDASQMASNGQQQGNGSGDQAEQARMLAQSIEKDGQPETVKTKEGQVFSSLLSAQMAAEASTAATASPGLATGIGDLPGSAMPISSSHGIQSLTPAGQAQAAQPARPQPAVPLHDQIGVHMAKAAKDGVSRINIELNPLELGKIEVRLDMSRDGRVVANIIAENRDTLAMLQQDAQGLQRSLQDAGLQADSGSLNFHLRGQERQFSQAGNDRRGSNGRRDAGVMEAVEADLTAKPQETLTADGGLDIRI